MFPVNISGVSADTDREVQIRHVGKSSEVETWSIPEETPVAFVYNQRNFAVMLATPADMIDYAVGFSLTEEVIDSVDDILGVDLTQSDVGIDLRIDISEHCIERFDIRQRRRNLTGKAGCGVCGLENADAFFANLPQVSKKPVSLEEKSISKAIHDLDQYQPINRRTRSVHGAAWVSIDGEILHLREDVGRHNALDKLLGALALNGVDTSAGFVLMSSRCSYELIEKAARLGVKALVSISGPTDFALRKAKEAHMSLYTQSSSGVVQIA